MKKIDLVLLLLVLFIVVIVPTGCTSTRYVEVPGPVHHDTIQTVRIERDSVWTHDSVWVCERGDSVVIDRWHVKYVERTVRDTVRRSVHDTVCVPVVRDVEKKVERELTAWQKLRLMLGNIMLVCAGVALVFFLARLRR